jgi:hypothetical protein
MAREMVLRDDAPPPANDNRWAHEPPVVRALRRRPDATYACSANVILPLAFAERMPSWRRARQRRG